MSKVVVLTQPTPGIQGLSVEVHVQTTVRFAADDARRRVNRDLVPDLGTGLGTGEPELHVGTDRIIWRVPIELSLPGLGLLGVVGAVPVDAQSGDIYFTNEDREKLIKHARRLYKGAILPAN